MISHKRPAYSVLRSLHSVRNVRSKPLEPQILERHRFPCVEHADCALDAGPIFNHAHNGVRLDAARSHNVQCQDSAPVVYEPACDLAPRSVNLATTHGVERLVPGSAANGAFLMHGEPVRGRPYLAPAGFMRALPNLRQLTGATGDRRSCRACDPRQNGASAFNYR